MPLSLMTTEMNKAWQYDARQLWVLNVGDIKPGEIEFTSNGGSSRIVVPVFHPAQPTRGELTGFVQSHGCISMEAGHFTRRRDQGGAAWQVVQGLGRSGDSVTVFPATVASRTDPARILSNSPALGDDMLLFSHGGVELHIDGLPTHPVAPDRGVRLSVSLDDGAPMLLDGPSPRYPEDVLTNLRLTSPLSPSTIRDGIHSRSGWWTLA